jgi:CRISPR-associated protein Csb2
MRCALVRQEAFVLARSKRDDEQPDRQPDQQGSFWRLTFPTPVQGPVVMGWGRFWGMGILGIAS